MVSWCIFDGISRYIIVDGISRNINVQKYVIKPLHLQQLFSWAEDRTTLIPH